MALHTNHAYGVEELAVLLLAFCYLQS